MEKEITLVSGEVVYPSLNANFDEKTYARLKAHLWLHMLNEHRKPKRFRKATKKGTRVRFDFIRTQEEYDQGIKELGVYIREVNEKFDFGIEIGSENEGD